MSHAIDLMDRQPLVVSPDLPLPKLAQLLLQARVDGVCVVEDGRLVGVVTSMDLIFQEKRVAFPRYVNLLRRLVGAGPSRKEAELEKATGTVVRDIMTRDAVGVTYDAPLEDIARLMVDEHISIVPVPQDGRLVGIISKQDVLRAALEHMGQG